MSVIFSVAGVYEVTDFMLSQWVIVNSVLWLLCCVNVGDVANVLEVHASILKAKACKMGVFPHTEVCRPTFIQNKHGEVEGGLVPCLDQ